MFYRGMLKQQYNLSSVWDKLSKIPQSNSRKTRVKVKVIEPSIVTQTNSQNYLNKNNNYKQNGYQMEQAESIIEVDKNRVRVIPEENVEQAIEGDFKEGLLSIKTLEQQQQKSLDLPLLIFIPGFEETGLPSQENLNSLSNSFDLKCLSIPTSDRTTFPELVNFTKKYIQKLSKEIPIDRPIYILGESFGALLAMAVSAECFEIIDRLIVINPASSIQNTNWPQIVPFFSLVPDQLIQLAPLAALPLVANPLNFNQNFNQQILQNLQVLQEQISSLQSAQFDDVIWKFKCMEEGTKYLEKTGYKKIQTRTLIITGNQDRFLPSNEEGKRLQKQIFFAKQVELQDYAHLILQQKNFDLLKVVKENKFYIQKRVMTSYPKKNVRTGNDYFKPGPIEIPSVEEMQLDKKSIFFEQFSKVYSPVFLSTAKDGAISLGLENVPENEQILFIGNHQPTILDFTFIVEKFLNERSSLIRTLAHPALFQISKNALAGFSKYGVLPVTPKNMFKTLQLGESAMMLPGGAKEALKSVKTHKYQLFWSENAEFVRMASKFGVTIVPFSSVGVEDGFTEILSSQEVLEIPIIGDYIKANNERRVRNLNPRAWQGSDEQAPLFVMPLGYPTVPQRYYIKFGAPIRTQKEWVNDKEKCTQVYEEVQTAVRDGLDYLQVRREDDPYNDFVSRIVYEASTGFQKQPPTFTP